MNEPATKFFNAALILVLLAVLSLSIGLYLFSTESDKHGTAWLFYLFALVLLIMGTYRFKGSRNVIAAPITVYELVLLVLIVTVGAFYRFHLLDLHPYGQWFDEAQNTLEAKQIIADPNYRPVFVAGLSQMPAMAFYYYAAFVELLGPTELEVYPTRFATTVAALFALVCVWLLGRELWSREVGLAAAAVLAISRWHIDFSRFGMSHLFTTVFVPLTLFFFVRSQKRLSLRDAVLSGMSLGIGLQFYYSMFVIPVLVVATFAQRFLAGCSRSFMALALLAVMLASMLFTYAPIIQYASSNWRAFNERMSTVSTIKVKSLKEAFDLFSKPSAERSEVLTTLSDTATKHARMFHFEGDNNGRHNLPGAPMLDPVTGVFFAIGFAWCLLLFFRVNYGMLLLWFGALISAGIFSLAFEAPQGARTFGLTPVIALMSALPLAKLFSLIAGKTRSFPRILLASFTLGLLFFFAARHNWTTYFEKQLFDASAWAAFSTPETKIGKVVKHEGAGADIYVPPTLLGGPTETLIIGGPLQARPFIGIRDLPLENTGKAAIIFVQAKEEQTLNMIKRLYPNSRAEPFAPPLSDNPPDHAILWVVRIGSHDIEKLSTWTTTFVSSGAEAHERSQTTRWEWQKSPISAPFKAQIRGTLNIKQSGDYKFRLTGNNEATLLISEQLVASNNQPGEIKLYTGNYAVALDVIVQDASGITELFWLPPGAEQEGLIPSNQMFSNKVNVGGLLGSYFNGLDWQDPPAFQQIDPQVSFYFHNTPLPRPFSIKWSGSINITDPGVYLFGTTSVDYTAIYLDGKEFLINNIQGQYSENSASLSSGWHQIELRYYTANNYSQVYLYWTKPGSERQLISPEVLRPTISK